MSIPINWSHLAQPIQDQGQCGSCTWFGLTGVMEALYKKKYGTDIKLSEKDGFFCSGGTCETGNTMEVPLEYAKNTGVATEECCPYGDVINGVNHPCGHGKCDEWWLHGVKIASWKKLLSKAEVEEALEEGPLFMSMAVPQSFLNYLGGIYHSLANDPIVGYHAIGCFGISKDQGWVEGRNSWGPSGWGEKSLSNHVDELGWFRAKTDDARLELEFYKVVVDGPIPEPDPGPPSSCCMGRILPDMVGWFRKKR